MSNPAIISRILRDTPLGYWRLNDAASSSTVADSSVNSRTASVIGGSVTLGNLGFLPGDTQTSCNFSNSGYFQTASAAGLQLSGSGTLGCFLNANQVAGHPAEKWVASGQNAEFFIGLTAGNGNVCAKLTTGSGVVTADSGISIFDASISNGALIVGTFDGANLKIYINNVLKATAAAGNIAYAGDYRVTLGQSTNGAIEHAWIAPVAAPLTSVDAYYAAATASFVNVVATTPWAGNANIAVQYVNAGTGGQFMSLLGIGDSQLARYQGALQRSLKPAKWVGFTTGIDVSTADGNYGFACDVSNNDGTWVTANLTAQSDGIRTYTENGSGTSANNGNANSNRIAGSGFISAYTYQQQLYRGDFFYEAIARGVSPTITYLVKQTATGDDSIFFAQICTVGATTALARTPASGHLKCSGSNTWVPVTVTVPTTFPVTPSGIFVGICTDYGLPLTGKTLTMGPWARMSTGELGLEFGAVPVGGTKPEDWAAADGVYKDELMSAWCRVCSVTHFLIHLGQNDNDPALYTGNITALISRVRGWVPGAGIILIGTYDTTGQWGAGNFAAIRDQTRSIAIADGNCLFIDLYQLFGPRQRNYTAGAMGNEFYDTYGLGDGTHPSFIGERGIAELIDMGLRMAATDSSAMLQAIKTQTDKIATNAADSPNAVTMQGRVDANVSSRLATSDYTAAPTVGQIDTQLTGTHGTGAWGNVSSGSGNINVDQNTGGANNLQVQIMGAGVSNVEICAFLQSDWDAGNRDIATYCKGQAITDTNGNWVSPMRLAAGTYAFQFNAPNMTFAPKLNVAVS